MADVDVPILVSYAKHVKEVLKKVLATSPGNQTTELLLPGKGEELPKLST